MKPKKAVERRDCIHYRTPNCPESGRIHCPKACVCFATKQVSRTPVKKERDR